MAPPMRQPHSAPAMVNPSRLSLAPSAETHRRDEVLLDRISRAGDDGGVIAEQQTAERGDDGQRDEKTGMSGCRGHWSEV